MATGAAVDIAHFDATFAIYGHVKEVEQVATDVCAAADPDTTALHWRVGSGVGGGPVRTAVERFRDVEMPDAGEAIRRQITWSGCAVKRNGCAPCVSSYCRWISDVL